MMDKLKSLILFISAAIDSQNNSSITIVSVSDAISNGNIFEFINDRIYSPYPFNKEVFTKKEREHLEAEWQVLLQAGGGPGNFAIKNNGLCLLLTYAAISIQENPDPILGLVRKESHNK